MADFFHDLRNKLTIIKGNIDLINEHVLSDTDKKLLQTAKAEIRAMQQLIDKSEGS